MALVHEELTGKILEACFVVSNELGAGFLELVYQKALLIALHQKGLQARPQTPIKVFFRGEEVGEFFADILVEGKVIVELKAVTALAKEHSAQVINYLKATYGINDSGQMVGTDNGHGLLFSGTGFASIPAFCGGGFCGSDARDINNNGIVVGDASSNTLYNYRHAISYDANSTLLTDLGTLTGGNSSRDNALNESGQIVCWSASSVGNRAFLYESGAMTDLNSLIDPTTGWVLREASDINESGQIVGWGLLNGQTRAFLITPVPEASTYGMLLAGLGLVWIAAQRRKQKSLKQDANGC